METILDKVERLERENVLLKQRIEQVEEEKKAFMKRGFDKFTLLKESFEQRIIPCKTCETIGNEKIKLRSQNSKLLEENLKLKQRLEN